MIAPMTPFPTCAPARPAGARPSPTCCRGAWVVGGAVRDVLLGGDAVDLDLVIEGDAVAAARQLARRSTAR